MKTISLDLFVAEVISNKDPEQKGRVQIFCPSFMRGWRKTDYLWAQQFSLATGGSDTFGSSRIPEEGTKVWAFLSNRILVRYPYYVADAVFDEFNPHKVFGDVVWGDIQSQIKSGNTLEYPHVKFTRAKNGICQFMCTDSSNPFWGVYHPTGAQLIINKNGRIFAGNKSNKLDHVVSETKLKNYFFERLGNLGTPLFADILTKDLSFEDFYGGINPSVNLPVPVTPPAPPSVDVGDPASIPFS